MRPCVPGLQMQLPVGLRDVLRVEDAALVTTRIQVGERGADEVRVDRSVDDRVRDVYALGVTIVLVEQNASRALAIADRGYVMESGLITMTGPGQELLSDPRVRAAYLGE